MTDVGVVEDRNQYPVHEDEASEEIQLKSPIPNPVFTPKSWLITTLSGRIQHTQENIDNAVKRYPISDRLG